MFFTNNLFTSFKIIFKIVFYFSKILSQIYSKHAVDSHFCFLFVNSHVIFEIIIPWAHISVVAFDFGNVLNFKFDIEAFSCYFNFSVSEI